MKRLALLSIVGLLLLPSGVANGGEADSLHRLSPANWSERIHLLAGGGLNTVQYVSATTHQRFGMGLNLSTALGYYLKPGLAVELASVVNFNSMSGVPLVSTLGYSADADILLWSSVFTAGIRARVPWVSFSEARAPYFRLFGGWGSTVGFFRDTDPNISELDNARIHFNGPVFGGGFGMFFQTAVRRVWFAELTAGVHVFRERYMVRGGTEIPIVLSREYVKDGAFIFGSALVIGLPVL